MNITIANGVIASAVASERPRIVIEGAELLVPRDAVVLPGFVDTHCHLMGLGQMAERVQLGGLRTMADCVSRVALHAFSAPPGEWILGFGWNETEWLDRARPELGALDSAAPDHPVALYRVDTHAVWINSAAIAAAGIAPREIDGGEVEVDADGRPTGLLIDNAVRLLDAVIPRPSASRMQRWIASAVERCLAYGMTEVHDMNVATDALDAALVAASAGDLRLRSSVFLEGMNYGWRDVGAPRSLAPTLDVVGVKYFTDGALGSRGALLLEPYSDALDTRGLALIERDDLIERASEAAACGHAIATHAIGDAANRLALDAYERLRSTHPEALLRIEHAQIVHPDDAPRFAALGVVAAMQPTHCTSDASMAEARLGPERCRTAYPWRTLLERGTRIIGGSDFPIESPDPLAGIRAFVRREPSPGAGAWFGDEAIDRASAVKAFTAWAPSGRPGSVRRGRLAEGYDADVVVLTGDPLDEGTSVLYTIVGGRVEYEGM
jgi:predicted amidohydrolase YtcJ